MESIVKICISQSQNSGSVQQKKDVDTLLLHITDLYANMSLLNY